MALECDPEWTQTEASYSLDPKRMGDFCVPPSSSARRDLTVLRKSIELPFLTAEDTGDEAYPKSRKAALADERFSPTNIISPQEDVLVPGAVVGAGNLKFGIKKEWWLNIPQKAFVQADSPIGQILAEQSFTRNSIVASQRKQIGDRTQATVKLSQESRSFGTPEKNNSLSVQWEHDFRYLLSEQSNNQAAWKDFYAKLGIDTDREDTSDPDWIQVAALRFLIANNDKITQETKEHQFFGQL